MADESNDTPRRGRPPKSESQGATVRMVRDDRYPEPHEADVHPDEVENWKLHDWVEA